MELNIWSITLTDIILFVTFVVVLWYALETHRLKNEMVRQNDLNLCPYILVDLDEGREGFIYENRGRGAALDIETENVTFKFADASKPLTVIFDRISHLLVDGSTIVRGKVLDDQGNDVGGFNILFSQFDPVVAKQEIKIPIRYNDILGSSYETVLGCGKGGIRIIGFIKKNKR